jgi:hypothetical protein
VLQPLCFVSAIAEFGKIDAIGNAPIIVILDRGVRRRSSARAAEPGDCARLVRRRNCRFIAVYYIAHALFFGTATV